MSIRAARFLLLCLILAITLSACSGKAATTAPSANSGSPANNAANAANSAPTSAATRTPVPSSTPFPTETPPSTPTTRPTETAVPTAVPTATPDPALSEVKLIGLAWMKDYQMLLSFQFPGPVGVDQYNVKLDAKDFKCQKLVKYPERLYCIGPGAKVLNYAWIRIYPAGSSTPGFEMKRWIPYFDNDYLNQFLPPY